MDAIFSKSVKANDRTYFIDVKEAKNKSKYLMLSETKPSKDGDKKYSRSTVMIFDSHIDGVREALDEAYAQMK